MGLRARLLCCSVWGCLGDFVGFLVGSLAFWVFFEGLWVGFVGIVGELWLPLVLSDPFLRCSRGMGFLGRFVGL